MPGGVRTCHEPFRVTKTLPGPLPARPCLKDRRQSEELRIQIYQADIAVDIVHLPKYPSITCPSTFSPHFSLAEQRTQLRSGPKQLDFSPRIETSANKQDTAQSSADGAGIMKRCCPTGPGAPTAVLPPGRNPGPFRFPLGTTIDRSYAIFLNSCLFLIETETGRSPAGLYFIMS